MNKVKAYGKMIEMFITKMTSPEIGQFRLEISTFRIILERARTSHPSLIKFTLTDDCKIVNNLKDNEGSIEALTVFLQKSIDFISSLIGEDMARDIIASSMKEDLTRLSEKLRGESDLVRSFPEPFSTLLTDAIELKKGSSDHEEILELFQEVYQAYLKDLSTHTDLSAFKLKLSILREKHDLIKYVELNKANYLEIDKERWASATKNEVKEALAAMFNSMVGLSTFLLGKEEALKKATRVFQYYFDGKDRILENYDMMNDILEGSLYKKISTGIGELDSKMRGGIPNGASLLLISPSGIERDLFISGLLKNGLNNGSSAMMVVSKEPPRTIRMLLRSNDLHPDDLEDSGRLRIIDWFSWRGERIIGVERDGHALKSSKILSNLGIAINKGLRELTFSSNKISIVHIIGPATNIFEFNEVYNFVQRLRAKFKDNDMASIFILETDSLSKEMESRLLEVFDGTLIIDKSMEDGKFKREIAIRSLSGIDFDANPIPFFIRDNLIIPEITITEEDLHKKGHISKNKKRTMKKDTRQPSTHKDEEIIILSTRSRVKDEIVTGPKIGKIPEEEKKVINKKRKITKPKKEGPPTVKPIVKLKVKRGKMKKKDDGTQEKMKKSMDSIDLGSHEGTPEDILKEAIDTINDLLDIETDLTKDAVTLKVHRKKIK